MASIIANIVNFGLDFFLIFGPPKMGVAGAALATSASQYISALALSGLLVAKQQLDPADLREMPPLAEIRMFLKVPLLDGAHAFHRRANTRTYACTFSLRQSLRRRQSVIATPGLQLCDMYVSKLAESEPSLRGTQAGISLSVRNVLSISVILTGTSLVANLGAVTLAAHEIVRQVRNVAPRRRWTLH